MQEGPWPQACAAAKHAQSALKQPRSKAESDDSERSGVGVQERDSTFSSQGLGKALGGSGI